MQSVTKYIESAQRVLIENPVLAGGLTGGLLLATLACCRSKHLKVNPAQCIVVITGCDTGFGLMTSQKLSKMGFLVVAACLTTEGVERLQGEVALAIQCNVMKQDDIVRLAEKTKELAAAKKAKVWTVVNNAGIGDGGGADRISSAAIRRVMEVNFFGTFEVTRAFLPLLKQCRDSRIINISSMAGLMGSSRMSVYCGKFR
jgi:NAD(P)-dependent dehydrogenase (short-subunit alcohol dehydrogenase family)